MPKKKSARFAEYVRRANERHLTGRERLGQAYFNELHDMYPVIAFVLQSNREYDPFYNDAALGRFLERVWELI